MNIADLVDKRVRFSIGSWTLEGDVLDIDATGMLFRVVEAWEGAAKFYQPGDLVFRSHAGGNIVTLKGGAS